MGLVDDDDLRVRPLPPALEHAGPERIDAGHLHAVPCVHELTAHDQAMANAELHEATPEGAEAELRSAINVAQADAKLEELKAELGLSAPEPTVIAEPTPQAEGESSGPEASS